MLLARRRARVPFFTKKPAPARLPGPHRADILPSCRSLHAQAQAHADHQPTSSSPRPPAPTTIFSGIQPTGVPHLGNYLGALKAWGQLQDEAAASTTLLYSVVDLHAITATKQDGQLRQSRRQTLAALLAVGLDPDRSVLFFQSAVPAHTELMWILSCTASMGYLSRMTQWKSKLSLRDEASPADQDARAKLALGLFSYPVLQAADILVHRATHVPVGEDQAQHLEFARECADRFNRMYGNMLPPPSTILSPAKRVMSLKQPLLKMSKSHPDANSRILINDPLPTIKQKVGMALTDSLPTITYDPDTRPGVANLLELMACMDERGRSCEALAQEYAQLSFGQLKRDVADCVSAGLAGVRDAYERVMAADDGRYLDDVAAKGGEKARRSADETMALVREAVGL
ncbi:MAG: Tryptophan--tRNA ligase, mitochondrial [Phylliscum demangeonii]|nr:MAG: Tryptophan--tRNA ligase, mitochondrial [Phylliscum demangeonii]